MTTSIGIHGVTKIELCASYPENGNSRTLRITSEDYNGHKSEHEITVYGVTDGLDVLPRAADFRLGHMKQEAAE